MAILATGIVVVLEGFQTSLLALGASRDALRADALLAELLADTELDLVTGGSAHAAADVGALTAAAAYRWAPLDEAQPIMIGDRGPSSNELHTVTVEVRHLVSGATHSAVTHIVARTP